MTLIEACQEAAKCSRETGQVVSPDELDALADGLREMVRGNQDWHRLLPDA